MMFKKFNTTLAVLVLVSLLAACGPLPIASAPMEPAATLMAASVATVVNSSISTSSYDELIALVNQYVASGDITGNVENGLLAKLNAIKPKLTAGQAAAAINEMGAFINEVEAQQGKKISTAAAQALIAKAQQVIVDLQPGVSAAVGTAVSRPTASSTLVGLNATPKPMGDLVQHQIQWDQTASILAGTAGFTKFTYEIYKLPANSTWLDTLKYYDEQAALAGWGVTHTQTNDLAGGHYAVWKVLTGDKSTYFVVGQMDTAQEGSYTLNIVGSD